MRLMIVDDNAIDQKICKRAALKTGLVDDLIMFSDPEDAVAYCCAAAEDTPDLVLLDLNMPRISGFDFLERMGEKDDGHLKPSSVVVLSSSINPEDREKALQHDLVLEYCDKPISSDKISELRTRTMGA